MTQNVSADDRRAGADPRLLAIYDTFKPMPETCCAYGADGTVWVHFEFRPESLSFRVRGGRVTCAVIRQG